MTRNVEDNAILLQSMAGYDPRDAAMNAYQKPNYSSKIGKSIKGLKVGIPKEYTSGSLSTEIKDLWKKTASILEKEGAEIIDISLPHTEYALAVYYIIAPAEASSNLARFDGIKYGVRAEGSNLQEVYQNSRSKGWGDEVKRRVLVGTYNLMSENFNNFLQAAKVRRLVTEDFIKSFKQVDVILTPTATSEAFPIDELPSDPKEIYLNDIFTVTANLAGLPGINIPVGLGKQGLPVGMQLIGNYFSEETLYQVAHSIESQVQFSHLPSFVIKNIS